MNAGAHDCVWTLVHLHCTSKFHTFKGNHQSLRGMCVRLTSKPFPIINILVECIDFSGLVAYCRLVTFFRIPHNIELKCSFVQCRKCHKSWWNVATELHILVDLLCGITAAELHNSVDLLCGTIDAELHNSPVNLLCSTTDAELNNPVWCMHQE